MFITVPNKFYPFETHGMQISSTDIGNILGVGIPFLSWMPMFVRNRVERARIYTQKRLLTLLREQGFEPIQIDYMMPPIDGKIQDIVIEHALRKFLAKIEATRFKYFGCHILVLAKST